MLTFLEHNTAKKISTKKYSELQDKHMQKFVKKLAGDDEEKAELIQDRLESGMPDSRFAGTSTHQKVFDLINQGYKVEESDGQKLLKRADNEWWSTKTIGELGMEYAHHLSNSKLNGPYIIDPSLTAQEEREEFLD